MRCLLLAFIFVPAVLAAQKPDTIHFSPFQRQQLVDLKTQADEIAKQQAIILRTIVASTQDPKTVEGWTIALTDSTIILSPPPKTPPVEPLKPKKP